MPGHRSKSIAASAMIALVSTPVLAEKADQLLFLNGRSAGEAERQLQSRGFRHESSHDSYSNGYTYSYWWNDRNDNCIRIEAYDRQVMTVADVKDRDCGHSGGSATAVLGVAAGAAILGALLSHKSHHHDDNEHENEDAAREFERGYRDGLHNASYHNYNRNDSYARGYEAGVDERRANVRHHKGRGGYNRTARFDDLRGARAAGGMNQLANRGFRQVDNFTSGNTRYSIQWRPQSRQCVQVTIADGRLYDLRDIGQHPQCR